MCRWITVLSSDDLSLSDIILAPQNSLLQLARDASYHPGYSDENNHTTNGDGFGLGWYHTNTVKVPRLPALNIISAQGQNNLYASTFRDTAPAWSNENLREICVSTRSHCIMAHVRAASSFAPVSQQNCHPFKAGRLLFCHNGRIGRFLDIRRSLMARISNEAYHAVRGTTDSEAMFALILTFLQEDDKNDDKIAPSLQAQPFTTSRLVHAIQKTLRYLSQLLQEAKATDDFSTLNFSLTDGESMVVTRFCDKNPQVVPPSLYFAYGNVQQLTDEITADDPEAFALDALLHEEDVLHDTTRPHLEQGGVASSTHSSAAEGTTSFDNHPILLRSRHSLPGLLYVDVDPTKAAFVVASNPLTKTHTWHPMPCNSIMWCTRGRMPELCLLREKQMFE